MRFLRQSLIGVFLAAVTLGLLVYAGQLVWIAAQERMAQETKTPPARERVFAVGVVRAEAGSETPILETYGGIQSRRTLELRAAAGGRVTFLAENFEDGGTVRKGDVLVRIDPADAQSALDRAKADLADAEAELRDAERVIGLARDEEAAAREQADLRQRAFERQKDLESRGVGTASAVETAELAASAARQAVLARRQAVTQAEARIDQGRTRLDRARIALAETERRLADTTVTAPFDGTLGATSVVVGRRVSANERLADLIDPDSLEVSMRISTAQYARLLDTAGNLVPATVTATLDLAGVDIEATGRVTRTSAAAGEGQSGRLVFARLDDARGFKPGDFVTVRIQEPVLDNVVRLPAAAYDASTGSVLVLGDENRLEQLDVTLVRRQGDDILVRSDDLPARDVVEARSPLLGAGIRVRPLERDRVAPAAPDMVALTDERRARLVAFIESNTRMPAEAKARALARLAEPMVPAQMVERIESRMGG